MELSRSCAMILWSFLLVWSGSGLLQVVKTGCSTASDCGWNSLCSVTGECLCLPGYSLAANKHDCHDDRCEDDACLECTNFRTCLRCTSFIERGTGRCLDACSTYYDLVVDGPQMGKVCPEGHGELNKTYLVVIISACAGVLITALLSLVIYWRFRMYSDRKTRIKFMEKMMERQKLETAKLQRLQQVGLDTNSLERAPPSADRPEYMRELTQLRPHKQVFLQMLNKAKVNLAALPPQDKKCFVYRNIIHGLSRVLVLLVDTDTPMPPDGNQLLQWARKILMQYLKTCTDSVQSPQQLPPTPPSSRAASSVIHSTFRPDQQLVPDADTFTYQRCPQPSAYVSSDSVDSIQQCREVSEISIVQLLSDNNVQSEDV